MQMRSLNEIKEKVRELWGIEPDVEVDGETVLIYIWSMFKAPGSFNQLMALSEFFATTNIDDVERIDQDGCESCDYGSKRGFVLAVKPEWDRDWSKHRRV